MKKTYMIPCQKIAELDMEAIIATSDPSLINELSNCDETYTKEDKSSFKSLWDEEW